MGELKEKMLRRMELKNFSKRTIQIYLFHILPKGFFKIRYYGILSSRKKRLALEQSRRILLNKEIHKNIDSFAESYSLKGWICPMCKEGIISTRNLYIRTAPT